MGVLSSLVVAVVLTATGLAVGTSGPGAPGADPGISRLAGPGMCC